MPLYEYFCPTCKDTFEQLRPAQKADEATTCPACRQPSSQRVLSIFASSVKSEGGGAAMPMSMPMAGGCCGGACGCRN
ncbi:MAG: zinc ribbon domain-containing protein [Caldilinea sp. CFX5]|nr:zinc ribbon domain-containing protein [Caldilinea sp. CFX5]